MQVSIHQSPLALPLSELQLPTTERMSYQKQVLVSKTVPHGLLA